MFTDFWRRFSQSFILVTMAEELSLVFDTEYFGLSCEDLSGETNLEVLKIVEENEEEVFLTTGLFMIVYLRSVLAKSKLFS